MPQGLRPVPLAEVIISHLPPPETHRQGLCSWADSTGIPLPVLPIHTPHLMACFSQH